VISWWNWWSYTFECQSSHDSSSSRHLSKSDLAVNMHALYNQPSDAPIPWVFHQFVANAALMLTGLYCRTLMFCGICFVIRTQFNVNGGSSYFEFGRCCVSMESHLWCYKIKLTSENCENPSPNKMKTEKVTSSVHHTVAHKSVVLGTNPVACNNVRKPGIYDHK
jgi:hypothetical protein